jgi:hypothetical protein
VGGTLLCAAPEPRTKETAVSTPLHDRVFDRHRVNTPECPGPLELGRQMENEEPSQGTDRASPCWVSDKGGYSRIILAPLTEYAISRQHLWVEPLPDGRARLTNKSTSAPVSFPDGPALEAGASRDVPLPVSVQLGPRKVLIELAGQPAPLASLDAATPPPGLANAASSLFQTVAAASSLPVAALMRWFQAVNDVLESAAIAPDFCERAAAALIDPLGLDVGRVLLLEGGRWVPKACRTAPGSARPACPSWAGKSRKRCYGTKSRSGVCPGRARPDCGRETPSSRRRS